jgi:hypothetical protein
MNHILQFFFDSARESLGVPARVMRLLDEHPDLCVQLHTPSAHIGLSSVVPWQDWAERPCNIYRERNAGWAVGWKQSGDRYTSFEATLPALVRLTKRSTDENWSCDIRDVQGLAASKSNLHEFLSMDAMVEANSQEMIANITTAGLQQNLAHKEIRIIHGTPGDDYFLRHRWDGRVFLMNSGGSHHFAAAKYIAARLSASVVLTGRLRTLSLDPAAVFELCDEYEVFAISDTPRLSVAFDSAMRIYGAAYLWRDMPTPWEHARAILLPRSERKSRKVAQALRAAGAFDIGQHLFGLAYAHAVPNS